MSDAPLTCGDVEPYITSPNRAYDFLFLDPMCGIFLCARFAENNCGSLPDLCERLKDANGARGWFTFTQTESTSRLPQDLTHRTPGKCR
jgi:hypothetical protein